MTDGVPANTAVSSRNFRHLPLQHPVDRSPPSTYAVCQLGQMEEPVRIRQSWLATRGVLGAFALPEGLASFRGLSRSSRGRRDVPLPGGGQVPDPRRSIPEMD